MIGKRLLVLIEVVNGLAKKHKHRFDHFNNHGEIDNAIDAACISGEFSAIAGILSEIQKKYQDEIDLKPKRD